MRFEKGDRGRQFFPFTGWLYGRVVREAGEETGPTWQEDVTGRIYPVTEATRNVTTEMEDDHE